MSDEMPVSSNDIADAITADLGAADQAQAPASQEVVAAPETPLEAAPATPAVEVAATPPAPLTLSDTSKIIDPADGVETTWGEIKAERLRWKDYTQKTMAVAEERKAAAAIREQYLAEQHALRTQQEVGQEDILPEGDPYAQRIRAIEARQQANFAAQEAERSALAAERVAAAEAQLNADVSRVSSEHKLDEREIDIVGRDLLARIQRGEPSTLDDVAKDFVAYRSAQRAAAVKEWQDKHRVGSPAAATAVPASGTPNDIPVPGTRAFEERMREEFAGIR